MRAIRTIARSMFRDPERRSRIVATAGALLLVSQLMGPARADADDTYRLAPGDTLTFDFVDDALPAEQLPVSSGGGVSIPLLGDFPVAGRTVTEALGAMRTAFVERKFLVDPQISLSVASFRPIYVLGDVKAPGSFAFHPLLNVEQAVALAGGQAVGGITAEDRVVARARLRGDIDEIEVQTAQEAVIAARLTVQLAGRSDLTADDLPPKTRPLIRDELLGALMPTARKILSTEQRGFETRRAQLTEAIAEVRSALVNLDELAQKQKAVIESARAESERVKTLNRRGLKTLTEVAGGERDATSQESHLLEIYNQASTTRRELGELQRQLDDLTDNRSRLALTDLQARTAEIERLLASRSSIEEQILLLGSLAADAERRAATVQFQYRIRRLEDDRAVTQDAALDTHVLPGDTVLVSIADGSTSMSALPLASRALEGLSQ
ncbi:polysaccharide biosynthesis/export family protein [Aureimonas phyllosphaerae]|uniref:Exopolysaccharide production protein ExoF n=1 Tax=Aureimonas phyllosphaerae TaxID=1166078 RepID=A0A7W6BT54_9HYPH|nr:polysaccharide biosynthesis/export family protein [Aureimonas phyllosphaerae]MBB3937536.1 exopolysaccharide production protein ExoF [Aureimonas phyllosphaerae]MBB3961664.1 exopolysaccharide production protein ExoF [Aureimonas phyllosphaerae]SFF46265.1 exopolysaccharide production protein ExoF [Aureimonas phyllosphaerae]